MLYVVEFQGLWRDPKVAWGNDSTFDFVPSPQSMNFWWQIVTLFTQRAVLSFLAGSNSEASNSESRGIKQICTAFLLMGPLIAPSSCPQFLLPHLVFIVSVLKNSLFGSSIFIVLWFLKFCMVFLPILYHTCVIFQKFFRIWFEAIFLGNH